MSWTSSSQLSRSANECADFLRNKWTQLWAKERAVLPTCLTWLAQAWYWAFPITVSVTGTSRSKEQEQRATTRSSWVYLLADRAAASRLDWRKAQFQFWARMRWSLVGRVKVFAWVSRTNFPPLAMRKYLSTFQRDNKARRGHCQCITRAQKTNAITSAELVDNAIWWTRTFQIRSTRAHK